jgi:hypothetical protein
MACAGARYVGTVKAFLSGTFEGSEKPIGVLASGSSRNVAFTAMVAF